MLFNSFQFALFFIVVTTLYFLLPQKFRWGLLLIASCLFYMAFIPIYILVLATTILVDYFAGIYIEKTVGRKRKLLLVISILSTCLVLFIFKYFNFFNTTAFSIAHFFNLQYPIGMLRIILPLGLSFHTFQSLSYVIEVYRGRQKAEKNFGIYSLYVMFYPQLVAGPIERPQNLLHQFREEHFFEYRRVVDGLKLMAWGLFKKIVIADRLAVMVNHTYADPINHNGLTLILATLFFTFQIYLDFSGYSDIAIGAAQVMGFNLMSNFNRPYISRSISEFWKRWHISLSTWFKDYVYIPLGGSRVSKLKWRFNIMITFLISGLWHGANWTYVVWGGLNGLYLIVSDFIAPFYKSLTAFLQLNWRLRGYLEIAGTFVLTSVAWIFFRASSISDAMYISKHLGFNITDFLHFEYIKNSVRDLGLGQTEFILSILFLIFLAIVHKMQAHEKMRHMFNDKSPWIRYSFYFLLSLSLIFFTFTSSRAFIYFQF